MLEIEFLHWIGTKFNITNGYGELVFIMVLSSKIEVFLDLYMVTESLIAVLIMPGDPS